MTVDEALERGNAALDAGSLPTALACFEQAIALAPDDGGGWAGKAGVLRAMGRHAEAIPAYDRVVELAPDVADLWFERADCLECVDRLPESLASYDAALARDPGMVPALIDRGHVLNRLKRHGDAVESYERALALDPRAYLAWFNKAEQERILGRTPAALRSFTRFFLTRPPGAHDQLVPHARQQVRTLVEAPPDAEAAPGWIALGKQGQALEAAGKLAEADAAYRQAIAAAPPEQRGKLLHNVGAMYTRAGRHELAIPAFREAVAADPSLAMTWTQLGLGLLEGRDPRPALEPFERALALAPDDARAWAGKAQALARLQRFADAAAAAERALALDPADDAKLMLLAKLRHQAGKYADALTLLGRIKKRDPQTLWLAGSCMLGLGKFAEALKVFEQVPGEGNDAVIDRGVALERLGRAEEAVAWYQKGHVMSGRKWFHLARHDQANAADYYGRAFEALAAEARVHGLDPQRAAELGQAVKKLKELDPGRHEEVAAFDRERREAMGLAVPGA